jgi:hypothetical protein
MPPSKGIVLEDELDDGVGIPLELDIEPPSAAVPAAAVPASLPAVTSPALAAAVAPKAELAPASGVEPEPDASEVQRLAGYGPPPRSAIEAPIYAVRVLLRRLELKRQVISSRKMLADAERASDEKLAAAMEELRAAAGPDHPLKAMFDSLSGHDAVAEAASGALEDIARRQKAELARRDTELSRLNEEQAQAEASLAEAERAAAARHEVRARTEARLKRAEIELRAAHEAARIAAGPGAKFAPPEHALRIKELEAARVDRAAELATAEAEHQQAIAATREPRARLRAAKRGIADIGQRAQRQERAEQSTLRQTTASAESALQRRRAGYAESAREVLRTRPQEFSESTREVARQAEALVTERGRALDLWVRTLDANDREAEAKGQVVLAVAAGAVLLLVLILLVV